MLHTHILPWLEHVQLLQRNAGTGGIGNHRIVSIIFFVCSLLYTGYDCVCSHLVNITSLLQITKGARERLTQHYIQRRWLDSTQSPSENELVQQALLRIKIDPSQYDTFLTMIRDTEGLDLIVKCLTYGQGEV